MNARFTRDPRNARRVTLHFPCELPILVVLSRPQPWAPGFPCIVSRATRLAGLAERLARVNAGRFSVELPHPWRSYHNFLEELVVVPGLVQLVHGDRYSLTIDVGGCFATRDVCHAVADCVTRHFYPADTIAVEPAPEYRRAVPNLAGPDQKAVTQPTPQA
ncbi:MAG: hypothetical protein FJ276_32045 [Planctomycetes bacterium]|nr:hypothetical protein [Planctomycetota bacterium]